jgi:uncharacterized membrane protein YccC
VNIEGGLIGWLQSHRAELRLSVRATTAGVLAFVVATLLNLPQGYWAVFTAIVVMQASVGGSVKTGIDWFVGTVGGAVFGVAIATLVPHENAYAMGSAIALAVIPTALLAALHASFRVAPLTAVIVVLGLNPDLSPFMSAFDRVLEIAVGSLTGIVVSLTVLPARAHGLAAAAAGEALGICAALLTTLLETIGAGASTDANEPLHNALRRALTRVETLTEEAARERASRLSAEPDTGPLARTLRRLRGDIVMINRTATAALPAEIAAKLAPSVLHIARADVGFLSLCAAALRDRTPPPSLDGVTTAMREYAACLAALRRDGMTIPLSDDDAGRLFALGFALEQLHQNFHDLASRTGELARVPA